MNQNENIILEVMAWFLLPVYIFVMVILTASIGVEEVK